MIDKYAHIGVTRALRSKRRINCREAARLLYQARLPSLSGGIEQMPNQMRLLT